MHKKPISVSCGSRQEKKEWYKNWVPHQINTAGIFPRPHTGELIFLQPQSPPPRTPPHTLFISVMVLELLDEHLKGFHWNAYHEGDLGDECRVVGTNKRWQGTQRQGAVGSITTPRHEGQGGGQAGNVVRPDESRRSSAQESCPHTSPGGVGWGGGVLISWEIIRSRSAVLSNGCIHLVQNLCVGGDFVRAWGKK